jgi:hypothetical protein
MGFNCSAGMTLRTPAGTITNIAATYEHDSLAEYDFVIPAATTNKVCAAAFPYADIKMALISASGACVIKTNDSGSPDDTITLTSTVLAKMFTHDGKAGNIAANPFTANVDTMYITNAGGAEITVKIRVLYDGTP